MSLLMSYIRISRVNDFMFYLLNFYILSEHQNLTLTPKFKFFRIWIPTPSRCKVRFVLAIDHSLPNHTKQCTNIISMMHRKKKKKKINKWYLAWTLGYNRSKILKKKIKILKKYREGRRRGCLEEKESAARDRSGRQLGKVAGAWWEKKGREKQRPKGL